jgi:hypothetical protein
MRHLAICATSSLAWHQAKISDQKSGTSAAARKTTFQKITFLILRKPVTPHPCGNVEIQFTQLLLPHCVALYQIQNKALKSKNKFPCRKLFCYIDI